MSTSQERMAVGVTPDGSASRNPRKRRWRGYMTQPLQPRPGGGGGPRPRWAELVGGMQWGRCSPSALQHCPSWRDHLEAPETLALRADAHCLRACHHAKAPCATIRRVGADSLSAHLHFHGAGNGMVRVNDQWVEADGEVIELNAGDVIELVCLQHAAMRHHGWYTASCVQRCGGGKVVAPIWRFVPQNCVEMLSPSDEVKSFFPRTPLLELDAPILDGSPLPLPPPLPSLADDSHSDELYGSHQTPPLCGECDDADADAGADADGQPSRKRSRQQHSREQHAAVWLRLAGAPPWSPAEPAAPPPPPLLLLPETEGWSWW